MLHNSLQRPHQLTKTLFYITKLNVANVHIARGLAVTANQDLIIVDREGSIIVLTGDETVSVIGDETVSGIRR